MGITIIICLTVLLCVAMVCALLWLKNRDACKSNSDLQSVSNQLSVITANLGSLQHGMTALMDMVGRSERHFTPRQNRPQIRKQT